MMKALIRNERDKTGSAVLEHGRKTNERVLKKTEYQ